MKDTGVNCDMLDCIHNCGEGECKGLPKIDEEQRCIQYEKRAHGSSRTQEAG